MDSLFKFIFYLIIIVIWSLNNVKKLEKKESASSLLPKQPEEPFEKDVQQPSFPEPAREGVFEDNTEAWELPDMGIKPYKQPLQIQKEKPVTEASSLFKEKKQAKESKVKREIKKPSLDLKYSLKQGIIWSIILGPPRSKAPFNAKGFPFQR